MFSLKDYIKVLDRMKKVGEDLLDIDKESGGLLSSLDKKEDSETNEMTSYTIFYQDLLLLTFLNSKEFPTKYYIK